MSYLIDVSKQRRRKEYTDASIVRRLKICIHSERGKKAGEKESIATLGAIGDFIKEKY